MNDIYFITDVDTPLGRELAKLILQSGYAVFGTISSANEGNDVQKAEKARIAITGKKVKDNIKIEIWRRHSAVSSRHILIKALTCFNAITNVILLGNPVLEKIDLNHIPIHRIESSIDGWIKGNFFLIKEFFNYFSGNGNRGNIAFVCQNYESKPSCVLNEVLRGSFISLISSLFADDDESGKQKNIIMNGFDSFQGSEADYAGYIFNTLREKAGKVSGKWFKLHNGFISRLTKR